jgi:hypothetical protein
MMISLLPGFAGLFTPLLAGASATAASGQAAPAADHGSAAAPVAGEALHGAAGHGAELDALVTMAVIVFFLAILAVAYFAPKIVDFTSHHDRIGNKKALNPSTALRSFSSGLAVAYVFVLLLPEFKIFGEKNILPYLNAFQLALIGLVVYKGLQHFCLLLANKRSEAMGDWAFVSAKQQERLLGFRVSTAVFVIYASLILLTLPYQLEHFPSINDKILYLLTFFLHLGFNLVGLYEEDEHHYHRFVPPVVACGLTIALVLTLFGVLSTGVLLTSLAFLAGVIIFSVFRNELPTAEKSSYIWFTFGVVFFAVAQVMTVSVVPH